jgi:hypothetical protein
MTFVSSMSCSEGRSFLISRRIASVHAFLPFRKLDQFRTVPKCWDERFCQLVPMQIAFGCCYQGMLKWYFHQQPRRSRRLRTSLRLLLQPLPILHMLLLLLLLLLPLLLPMLLHLLLVKSARPVHNPKQALIPSNCNCGSLVRGDITDVHLYFQGVTLSLHTVIIEFYF